MNDDANELEKLRAELELLKNRFDEELERQKIDALAEFAAGAGHEINNPLAIINGHAELLLREIENTEHRRHLAIIAAQTKRAYEMIADIRYFARPPAPEPETFDLLEDLRRLIEEQSPLMRESNVRLHLETNVPEGEPFSITTDPVQLHVAALFLCNNAREILSEAGGNIRLYVKRTESGVDISVEDDGPGVAEEIRPLIFCPYYSGRQAGRGLGFGLPKAWRIMQRLGGSIRHENPESGRGARFVLSLPLEE